MNFTRYTKWGRHLSIALVATVLSACGGGSGASGSGSFSFLDAAKATLLPVAETAPVSLEQTPEPAPAPASQFLLAAALPESSTTDASVKAVRVQEKALDSSWVKIADEGQRIDVGTSLVVVQYGSGTLFNSKSVKGTIVCNNLTFGDPSPFTAKSCYRQTTAPAGTAAVTGAKLALEGQNFTLTAATIVSYGADTRWIDKTLTIGTYQCGNVSFGNDPAMYVAKSCVSKGAAPAPVSVNGWTKVASEGQDFTLAASTTVRYGFGTMWSTKTLTGAQFCSNAVFGGDPAFGYPKSCETQDVTAPIPAKPAPVPAPVPTPTPAPVPTPAPGTSTGGATGGTTAPPTDVGVPVAGDIVNTDGTVNAASWDAMYAAAGTDTWIEYTRGKASTAIGGVKLYERPHIKVPDDARNPGQTRAVYEHGGYTYDDGGFYSTSQGDVVTFGDTNGSGVVSLQTSGYTNNTGQLKPQPQWQVGYNIDHKNFPGYRASGVLPAGNVKPMFVASSNDISSENGTSRLVGTVDGTIFGVGSNTAANSVSVKLAPGKLPVAAAMTNKAEFVFVPVWDKATRKGQVAVVITCGMPDNSRWTDAINNEDWWNEWRECYPGLPNQGNTAFLKVLAYVDIPGMSAPTSVAVNTGMHPWEALSPGFQSQNGGNGIFFAMSPIQDHYTQMRDGGQYGGKIARGGLLSVASKSEKKVVYFDLAPLMAWVYDSYYGANHTRGERKNLGLGDAQWPQTMAISGVTLPVVKTQTFANQVAAVKFTGTRPSIYSQGEPFSWVVTNSEAGVGSVHTFAVGGCVPGVNNTRTCQSSNIVEKSSMTGLPYVSSIATMLGMKQTGNVDLNTGFWFVGRPGRDVGYVRMSNDGTSGVIGLQYKTNIDQCADPVGLADIDNYSNEANAQLLMCYNDRKVATYRTDILHSNGSWSGWAQNTPVIGTSGVLVEYYGAFPTSGKPVHALTANVP